MAQIIDPLADAANTIQGTAGETNDLIALGGDDTIIGANLADFIRGGRGNDTITGGAGADTVRFEYNSLDYISEFPQPDGFPVPLLEKWGHDVWTDFSIAEGDKLDVSDAGMGEQIDHAWGIGELETIIANSSIVNGALRFTWGSASITLQGVTSLDQLVASMFVFDTVEFNDYVLNFSEDLSPDLIGDDVQAYGGGSDTASGGGGNDQLYGEQGDDELDGGTGNDTLYGGSGNDTLYGGRDSDHLYGGSGNDILSALSDDEHSNESMYGGDGDDIYYVDTLIFSPLSFELLKRDSVWEEENGGIDTVVWSGASLLGNFYGYKLPDNVENFINKSGAFVGVPSQQFPQVQAVLGGIGNELNNVMIGSADFMNNLNGEAGDDELWGNYREDELRGGAGNDVLHGEGRRDVLLGEDNEDTLHGGDGNDRLEGGRHNDTLNGDAGNDSLDGGTHSDTLNGGSGNDTFITSSGNDEVFGDTGNDTVTGISAGAFFFDGGAGVDKLDMSDATGRISLTLKGSNLAFVFVNRIFDDTISNVESVVGGKFADSLIGDAAANWLDGGLGLDTLTGGAGADRFVFATKPSSSSNYDRITDFKLSDDKIALDETIFKKIGPTLSSSEFVTGTRAKDSNDYIIYNRNLGTLSYDADGSGSGAAVKFAVVKSGLILKNTHFMLDDF